MRQTESQASIAIIFEPQTHGYYTYVRGSNEKEPHMNNRQTCIIWTIDKETLQRYLDESSTFKEVIVNKLGMKMNVAQTHFYRRLRERIVKDGLNTSKFENNKTKFRKSTLRAIARRIALTDEECFVENSKVDRGTIKKKIRNRNLIEYRCKLCEVGPEWNGKELSLELDHINQVNNDNRLENLRFLCPNCHSQVTNEHRVSCRVSNTNFCKCGTVKNRKSMRCRSCSCREIGSFSRKFNPSKEELISVLEKYNYNMVAVGKHYDVKDNSIRKRCRLLGIEWKK